MFRSVGCAEGEEAGLALRRSSLPVRLSSASSRSGFRSSAGVSLTFVVWPQPPTQTNAPANSQALPSWALGMSFTLSPCSSGWLLRLGLGFWRLLICYGVYRLLERAFLFLRNIWRHI